MSAHNDLRNQEAARVLDHVYSNNDECCVAVLNGVRLAAFLTIRYLCAALQGSFTIHTLSLSRCDLTTTNAERIASALKYQDKLQSLDLSNNPIGPSGILTISLHIHTIPGLTRLNLENTNLGDSGVIAVAENLLNHTTLDSLNLARNFICDRAAYHLARALTQSSLGWLDVSHNQINNNGAQHLVLALRSRRQYLRLDLHGNHGIPHHILEAVTALNRHWEAAQQLELENDVHEPRPALLPCNMPPPPLPSLMRLHSIRARLVASFETRDVEPVLLHVQQGELQPEAIPEDVAQGDLPVLVDRVPDPGTCHRDVPAWEDITRSITFNFHGSLLVEQTNAFQVYRCEGHDIAETPLEGRLLLRRINPSATRAAVNRDEEIANFMERNTNIRVQGHTYVPMLCVVLPQYGNIYQFFHRDGAILPKLHSK